MEFNFFQIFILFGLLQGILCMIILLCSSTIRSKSNFYLSLLILAFIGNVGLYWLKDVGFISNNTMQLLFLPWQMLVAPLFYLYVRSLKIFDQFLFRRWILFAPLIVTFIVHLYIKVLMLTSPSVESWIKPDWVSSFYLMEELVSLGYCLILTIFVYRLIWQEKRRLNFNGFGLNKGIVTWIKRMLQMGLILAAIWIVSLLRIYGTSESFEGYYLLWSVMVIVLNILGGVGIFYSIKGGGFSKITLSGDVKNGDSVTVSTPQKYAHPPFLDSVIMLSSALSTVSSEQGLQGQFGKWFSKEFGLKDIGFIEGQRALDEKNKVLIPYSDKGLVQNFVSFSKNGSDKIDDETAYNMSIAIKAFAHHKQRINEAFNNEKITSTNKVYLALLDLFSSEDFFTEPTLDLNLLASKLEVSSGYLSKVINDVSGKSFNEFVNDYRVEKVKDLMGNSEFSHYTVLGLGLEAGFNSKSTYYKAFQKRVGQSPGKYYESLKLI